MIQRCYIAGRISGIPRDCVEMFFAQAETEVEKMGYEVYSYVKCIRISGIVPTIRDRVEFMTWCDAIYVLKGFGDQYDERIEIGLIQSLGIKIIYQK